MRKIDWLYRPWPITKLELPGTLRRWLLSSLAFLGGDNSDFNLSIEPILAARAIDFGLVTPFDLLLLFELTFGGRA